MYTIVHFNEFIFIDEKVKEFSVSIDDFVIFFRLCLKKITLNDTSKCLRCVIESFSGTTEKK